MEFSHISVMLEESVRLLAPHSGGVYVDGTLGGAGHARLILQQSAPDGKLIGFDRDEMALATAARRLAVFGDRVFLVHGNFDSLAEVLAQRGIGSIDGIILDLGVSSPQLDSAERGFSFQQDAPLDMRMDRSRGETASDLVNRLDEQELARVIKEFGEERWARRIAAAIIRARVEQPLATTLQLAGVIQSAIPRKFWEERIHPATRTFQALRIAVNDELGSLERGLDEALRLLGPGGRAVVISFHSLEDRIVKNAFRKLSGECTCPRSLPVCICGASAQVRAVTRKPLTADEAEVARNPRARSARLRAVEKI